MSLQDKLCSSIRDTCVKAATTPGTISVHPNIYLSEVVDKDEHKAANEFFKYLGSNFFSNQNGIK